MRRTLLNLPEGLEPTYKCLLSRVYAAPRSDRVKRLLSWILCTKRPLTVQELRDAFSVESGDTSLGEDSLVDIESLVLSSAGIITIDKPSGTVRFVHFTFQEFISKHMPVVLKEVQLDIAQTSISYLLFDSFSSGRCKRDEEMTKRIAETPFFLYAAKHWGYHIRGYGETAPQSEGQIQRLLCSKSRFDSCLQAFLLPLNHYEGYSCTSPVHAPPLWLATSFGLHKTCSMLLRGGYSIHDENSIGETALYLAVALGDYELAAMYINMGARKEGSANPSFDAIPLHEASKLGHLKVLALLIGAGADVHRRSRSGRTALHEAVGGNQEEVCQLLITLGLDVTIETTGSHWTALHTAVNQGNYHLTQLLLKHGASPNAKTSEDTTAVHVAAERGHETVLQALMNAKATQMFRV
jgi:hypothetical protein